MLAITKRKKSAIAGIAASDRLKAILSQPLPTNDANSSELEPHELRLSEAARKILFDYYRFTELGQALGGDLEHIKSFASKSPEQAARIAGVLTLWSDLTATVITPETMSDGIELAQFYLSESLRLCEAAAISEHAERADNLRRWLINSWPEVAAAQNRDPAHILPSDVVQYGPNALRETSVVKKLMRTLEEHCWLVEMEPGVVIAGKARQLAYRIVRQI